MADITRPRGTVFRAFEHGMDIQDATERAIKAWYTADNLPDVDTAGAKTCGTFLPVGEPDTFKNACTQRGATYVQGLAQALTLWLETRPSPSTCRLTLPSDSPPEDELHARNYEWPMRDPMRV